MLYFAYGSNLCESRLVARAPSASFVGVGYLGEHSLRFHKRGRDGTGKADALAGVAGEVVWGAIAEVAADDLARLDTFEPGYERRRLSVSHSDGAAMAWVYRAAAHAIDPGLRALRWYRDHVVAGGKARGLPTDYIQRISSIPVLASSPGDVASC